MLIYLGHRSPICHILNINHILSIVSLRTVFGHTTNLENFWTEICLISPTSDGLGQIFFPETGASSEYNSQ